MKLVWSPETASKAYIDTVKTCKKFKESHDAEMISAMAGGWKPGLIVEAWSSGSGITTSIGLEMAARHSGARHVCTVQNECARSEYVAAMMDHGLRVPELVVGEAKEVMARLSEIEFMVVDGRRRDLCELFGSAKLSGRGAVLLCRNATVGFGWEMVAGVVRSVVIPMGQGLDIAYVRKNRRWVTRTDQQTGEEHVFRG